MKHIRSRENPEYRRLLRLGQSGRERRDCGLIVLDGIHLVEAYLAAAGSERVSLFVRESAADDAQIQALVQVHEANTTCLADRLFDATSPVETPTGLIAVAPVPKLQPAPLEDGDRLLVLIDGVQDPGNLGSILRSAAAAGAWAAWLSEGCADPWSPKSLRGGMGAQFRIPVQTTVDLTAAVRACPCRLLAADSDAGDSVYEADFSGPLAIAIGAEGRGVSPDLLALAQARIKIPMETGIDSLNAAAAAAILFFEWRRRRA